MKNVLKLSLISGVLAGIVATVILVAFDHMQYGSITLISTTQYLVLLISICFIVSLFIQTIKYFFLKGNSKSSDTPDDK